MRRREFIALVGGAIVCPMGVRAQPQAGKVPRIGYLGVTSPSDRPSLLDAFRQSLRELGWVEGHNIVIDYRYAEGRVGRLPDLAAELVRLKVDVIVSFGNARSDGSQECHGDDSHRNDCRSRSCWHRAHREPRAAGRERHRGVRLRRPGKRRQTTGASQGDGSRNPQCGHPLEPDQRVPSARDKGSERRGPGVGRAASTPGGSRCE